MVRELSGHDPTRYEAVLDWPLGEALLAYEERLKDDARRDHQVEYLAWSALAATGATKQKKAPQLPAILKD